MSSQLPTIPGETTAALPARYEAAKSAIAACDSIDECKDWSDKARALAAYARMANDDTMRLMALRIQARALRRAGELLKQIPRADESTRYGQDGTVPPVTRTATAEQAGLSERQRKTALRVASVPTQEFDQAVESMHPPTVTELAMRGTVPRASAPEPETPPAAQEDVDDTQSALQAFAEFCRTHEAASIARAIPPGDAVVLRGCVAQIDAWLDRFVTNFRS